MSLNNPWKSYRQVSMQTAPPGQLVLMLYEGAIKFLDRALLGFTMDDPAECNQTINNNVMRAQDIIRELSVSLNMNEGGEFAANLYRLYDYLDRRLQESNLKKQDTGIREVIARLSTLRDAWASMLRGETIVPAQAQSQDARALVAA